MLLVLRAIILFSRGSYLRLLDPVQLKFRFLADAPCKVSKARPPKTRRPRRVAEKLEELDQG